jgi:hypothetical protein
LLPRELKLDAKEEQELMQYEVALRLKTPANVPMAKN